MSVAYPLTWSVHHLSPVAVWLPCVSRGQTLSFEHLRRNHRSYGTCWNSMVPLGDCTVHLKVKFCSYNTSQAQQLHATSGCERYRTANKTVKNPKRRSTAVPDNSAMLQILLYADSASRKAAILARTSPKAGLNLMTRLLPSKLRLC